MQVLKKIYILALVIVLSACQSAVISRGYFEESSGQINEEEFVTSQSFRVGVLLPLSGEAEKAGQGLKNAAMLALEDMNNPNLILQFYDTKSTPEGARVAVENAINQQVKLVIGPLMSSSVEAISSRTRRSNIPVIAFSTNQDVLQDQVYTIGLLIEEQINRIVGYATSKGRSKFALLLPDNSTGLAVAKAAVKSTKKHGATVVRIAFYDPNTNDFSTIINQLSDFEKRAEPIKKEKERLAELVKLGDEQAKTDLKKLSLIETEEGVDFDAVIIPETGSKLKSATAMFGYYDVFAPDVMFLGTSVWENTHLNKESTLYKAAYPVLSRSHGAYFNNKYRMLYETQPNGLFAFAYDAVALASALAKRNPTNLDMAITTPDGFAGINGIFRLFENGKNQHSLDIMQITPSGDIVIDAAPKKFSSVPESLEDIDVSILYDRNPPLIFGKDEIEAQELIFGRELEKAEEIEETENTDDSLLMYKY